MKAKFLFWLLTTVLLATAPVAQGQQAGKLFRISLLDSSNAAASALRLEAFWQEIRKLGWIEGKNITIEQRFAEQKAERMPELAAELIRLKPDVIVVAGTTAAQAAKNATTTIPIVITNAADPVGSGLVASLARPGGNVTGVTGIAGQLNTKRLEVLKDAIPRLARVGVLIPPGGGSSSSQLEEFRQAALALKLKLEEITTQLDTKGIESAFQSATQKQIQAIQPISSPRLFAERKRIIDLAVKYRLPAMYYQKEFVEDGGLMSYGVDFDELVRNAAHYVDKILKGAKPADLPVQQAMKFEFLINLKAAKQIGLTIPPDVLARANQVIK